MITIRLIVPDVDRRALLSGVFEKATDLNVVYSTPDLDEVIGESNLGISADLIVIDLSLFRTNQHIFWAILHQFYTCSRLMAVIGPATSQSTIELALVAGAAWLGQWTDSA